MRFIQSDTTPLPGRPALQQHPFYANTLRMLGLDVLRVTARDPDPAAHILAVRRRFGPFRVAWVPHGPVWSDTVSSEQRVAVLHHLRRVLCPSHLQLVAAQDAADQHIMKGIGFRALSLPQSHAWLDLQPDAATRLARQHGKWRNRLRHAQSAKLKIRARPFCPDRDQKLLTLEEAQRRIKGYRALPARFTHAWATSNPDTAQVFEAYEPGGLAAFILVLTHAPTATYHIGWSNETGRALSAHNLLLWEAANWLSASGYCALDLGLIDHKNAPGLTRFKLGTGAEIRTGGATCLALPRLSLPSLRHKAA
ncbi:GNAT family N-acetyltransferase [Roseovarius faecimaris]|uniref:GNAT family N-acetyltransferase n=1 Tax=Roseovarius faecimaris TaxID=2494550 RepID=A0A6I6IRT6_9RHOB|nr:GNAT family N-acetyltransferase [Roseovarius faecimaris]QGX98591.1 GNAT family N-acetyltransferase [Roseovarius faecimaris]